MLGIPVLVVEDHDDDLELLRLALRELPVVVSRAKTLAEALALLRTRTFDVVLLDLALPDAKGLEGVRRTSELHDAIVVLTGDAEADALMAIREGADDFILKGAGGPAVRHVVLTTMERAFRRRAAGLRGGSR